MRSGRLGSWSGLAAAMLAVAVSHCAQSPPSPEDEIRAVFGAAAAAARAKDAAAFKEIISDRYRDDEGRDKNALRGILGYYLIQHRSVHILTRVQSVEFPVANRAEAVVIAALAGTELPEGALVPSLDADMYRIDAALAREGGGKWRITRANWRPATTEDFE